MTPRRIANAYVVDAGVALLGGTPTAWHATEQRPIAAASAAFLSRAAFHGATLHVPSVFLSELTDFVFTDWVAPGRLELPAGQRLLEDLLLTGWDVHFVVFTEALALQHRLGVAGNTAAGEYLALAAQTQSAWITHDAALVHDVRARGLGVPITHVTEHVWSQSGGLEDSPPDVER
ncbi:MAG: type II toxin-antitoxin system VapC family toxin [Pleurocapsa sp. SU_196_0]|nr:type II toxin-antitoxin system VapC family toxin [Pleurocapsa sp. SU_196_0]